MKGLKLIGLCWLLSAFPVLLRAQSKPIQLSLQLLNALYTNQQTDPYIAELAEMSPESLKQTLTGDSIKKAFWINIYNASLQLSWVDSADRSREKVFFNRKIIKVAGKELSLNDIEHGMLRVSKSSRGKKKMNKWRVSEFEKQFRLSKPDWKIYFALNTGLSTDAYIYFHSEESIHRELDMKARQYARSQINHEQLSLDCRFTCYMRDSGGESAILTYMNELKIPVKKIVIHCDMPVTYKPRYFIGMK